MNRRLLVLLTFFTLLFLATANAKLFDITILSHPDKGNYSDITITLDGPASGEYIENTEQVNFSYHVTYDSSDTVHCNVSMDGSVIKSNIQTDTNVQIEMQHDLADGVHDWRVDCWNESLTKQSETRSFTIDLTAPTLQLETEDNKIINSDTAQLEFTATDDKYTVLDCRLMIDDQWNQTKLVTSGSTNAFSLIGLTSGVYQWNVSCEDGAKNKVSSESRSFYISITGQESFNLTPNKNEFNIAEAGYFVINAPQGSNLTLFINDPVGGSTFREFEGKLFPFIEQIDYTDYPGTYNIDGIFTYQGQMFIIRASFDVVNNFHVSMDTNATSVKRDSVIRFEGNTTGGVGNIDYSWDFDDGTSGAGANVDHAFATTGKFNVKLLATDSISNTADAYRTINVYDEYTVTVTVTDTDSGAPVYNASVELAGLRQPTDTNGQATFTVDNGKQRIYVYHPDYEYTKQVEEINEAKSIAIAIKKFDHIFDVEEFYSNVENQTEEVTDESENGELDSAELTAAATGLYDQLEDLIGTTETSLEELEKADREVKEMDDALGVSDSLRNAKKEIRQLMRDLARIESNVNQLNSTKEDRLKTLKDRRDNLEKETIMGLKVIDSGEYVEYPTKEDVTEIALAYLGEKKKMTRKDQKEYLAAVQTLQKRASFTTRVKVADIEFLSGEKSTITLMLVQSGSKTNGTGGVLIEMIPKDVAESSDDIVILSEYEVIKKDPIIQFNELSKDIKYYLQGKHTVEETKAIKRIVVPGLKKGKRSMEGVTGRSIFSAITDSENLTLIIEVVVIFILLGAYLAYHFDMLGRFKQNSCATAINKGSKVISQGAKVINKSAEVINKGAKAINNVQIKCDIPNTRDAAHHQENWTGKVAKTMTKARQFVMKEERMIANELNNIRFMMQRAHSNIEDGKAENAVMMYDDVMDVYKSLSPSAKSLVLQDTKELYSKILLTNVEQRIDDAYMNIMYENYSHAKKNYVEIRQLYGQLIGPHKLMVKDQCRNIHERLNC